MKKTVSFLLVLSLMIGVLSVGVYAFEPMNSAQIKEMLDANLEEDEFGGLAFGWGFEDVPTVTKEYVKDAFEEAKKFSSKKGYELTEWTADIIEGAEIDGLSAALTLAYASSSVTVYKFSTEKEAEAYARTLEEQYAPKDEGEESDAEERVTPYVRHCGLSVATGDRELVYNIGVTVVEDVVPVGENSLFNYFTADKFEGICDGAYTSVKESFRGGIEFKTPDSAIKLKDGAIVISEAYKDYHVTSGSYGGLLSSDAYMDIYTTGNPKYSDHHDAHAGAGFVFSARMKAPFDYMASKATGKMTIFSPRSHFSKNSVNEKMVFDQPLLKYDISTKELLIVDGGEEVATGISLSQYEYMTVAVHVKPKTNSFDFYVDGILVAKDATFLTEANIARIYDSETGKITANVEDYTLTRARLFYASRTFLTGELLYIDEFSWYFSEEYLEKNAFPETVSAISMDVGDTPYMNVYLSLPNAAAYDYMTTVEFSSKKRTHSLMLMSGEKVADGRYKGLYKYSMPIGFDELTEEIEISLKSTVGATPCFYGENAQSKGLCKIDSYTVSPIDYLTGIMTADYGEEMKDYVKALLNYSSAVTEYKEGLKYGQTVTKELPNKGFEYTNEELEAVTSDMIVAAVNSEKYKAVTVLGNVENLTLKSTALDFDGGIYLVLTFKYVGMRTLSLNGNVFDGTEYRIKIDSLNHAKEAYTVVLDDGNSYMQVSVSPFTVAAELMNKKGVRSYEKKLVRAIYLYTEKSEEYSSKTNG